MKTVWQHTNKTVSPFAKQQNYASAVNDGDAKLHRYLSAGITRGKEGDPWEDQTAKPLRRAAPLCQ